MVDVHVGYCNKLGCRVNSWEHTMCHVAPSCDSISFAHVRYVCAYAVMLLDSIPFALGYVAGGSRW